MGFRGFGVLGFWGFGGFGGLGFRVLCLGFWGGGLGGVGLWAAGGGRTRVARSATRRA